jgi:hypothetical protein
MTRSRFAIQPRDTRQEFDQLWGENVYLRELLNEALTEIARWRSEALDRRRAMMKMQRESLLPMGIGRGLDDGNGS